ncbi:MAG TPA: S8 family serine peptidase [Thermoanaerobaculia bacterium]
MNRWISTAFLLCLVATVAIAGGSTPLVQVHRDDGQTITSAISVPKNGRVPVIVQFRDTPLFERAANGSASAKREAQRAFADRFATFERDLTNIERELARRPGVSTQAATTEGRITQRFSRVYSGAALTVSADAIERIAQLDYVRAVHPDRTLRASLERSVPKIRAPEVWSQLGTRGRNIVVAILDTGVDYRHPALGGAFGPGQRVAGGYDFINKDADPMDDDGHGTHVAAIVGGNGGGITGVAPEVTFLAYKVLDEEGHGRESTIVAGVERAADPNQDGNPADHVHVANMSLGAPGDPDSPLTQAVERASAAGVIFCIAAGNDGGYQRIGSPGNAPSAITVGASSIDDQLASFTSKGPIVQSLEIKPEVVAPGENIMSASIGGGTEPMSGTSMATPHVSGIAALLRAIHPDWPAAHIKAAIVGTAVGLTKNAMAEGAGRVDALRAATADVIVQQSVLSLGGASSAEAHWLSRSTVTLVNHGTVARTLTLTAESPHAGIGVTLDVTTVVLEPGASRDVHLTVDVDSAAVPVPESDSLSYSGAIEIAGGAVPLRVPWAFVKGAAVTIDYDGPEMYEALLFGIGTTTVGHVPTESRGRSSVLLPHGTYDVQLFPLPGMAGEQPVIVVEQQVVQGSTTIPVRRASAVHELELSAEDEKGADIREGRRCQQYLALIGPSQTVNGVTIVSATGGKFLGSAISDRFTLLTFEQCNDELDRKRAYGGQYAPLTGLAASQKLTIEKSDWSRTPIRMKVPEGAVQPTAVILTGWLWHGTRESSASSWGLAEAVTGSEWEGTLYLTASRHPAMSATGKAQIKGSAAVRPWVLLESPRLRRTEAGIMPWAYKTATPATYVARENETLVFGEGLWYVQPIVTRALWLLVMRPEYRGALGEDRLGEMTGSRAVLRDSTGTVVDAPRAADWRNIDVPPGRYDYEVTKPFTLRGIAGSALLHARFDTTLEDVAPPLLTTFQLLDAGGRNRTSLVRGQGGTLQFSAMDLIPSGDRQELTFAPVRTESLTVQWRPHGTSAWLPLRTTHIATEIANTAAEQAALGHPGLGSTFRADLMAASQSTAAAIDLTVRFEDASGNSYEWTLAPAVAIDESGGRRRAAGR